MPVYMTNHKGEMIKSTVAELLPHGFFGKGFRINDRTQIDLYLL